MRQVFESGPMSALLVDGAPGNNTFRLREIQVLEEPGKHPILEQNVARLLYIIQNGAGSGSQGFGAAVRVVMRSEGPFLIGGCARDDCDGSVMDADSGGIQRLWGPIDGSTTIAWLSPDRESGVCQWVVQLCKEQIRTSEVLEELAAAEGYKKSVLLDQPKDWMRSKHICIARMYCRQRILLLRRVIQDLEAQINLSQACD